MPVASDYVETIVDDDKNDVDINDADVEAGMLDVVVINSDIGTSAGVEGTLLHVARVILIPRIQHTIGNRTIVLADENPFVEHTKYISPLLSKVLDVAVANLYSIELSTAMVSIDDLLWSLLVNTCAAGVFLP